MADSNPLWALIQAYMDDSKHRYPPKPADLARETGVSDQVISKWKYKPTLPSSEQLFRFAKGTGLDYLELLAAALVGKGYLPTNVNAQIRVDYFSGDLTFLNAQEEGSGEHADRSATTKTPAVGPAYQPTTRAGEEPVGTVTSLSDRSSTLKAPEPRVAKKRPPKKPGGDEGEQ